MADIALATRPAHTAEARDRLRVIIDDKSLLKGGFKLSSGQQTDYFFNMKMTMLDPEGSNLIADAILDLLQDEQNLGSLGGMALGAVPIVAVVCSKSHLRGAPVQVFFVRNDPKQHGTRQQIEGYITQGSRVILVDDVTTTGGSVMKAVRAARDVGCKVDTVITVVDRLEGAKENLAKEGIRLVPLYTRRDFE